MTKDDLKYLLVQSFDQELSQEQKEILADALNRFDWMKEEREAIVQLRAQLASFRASQDDAFVDRVMIAVDETYPQSTTTIMVRWFPQVAAACILMAIAFIVNLYLSQGAMNVDGLVGLEDVSPEEAFSYLMYYQ